MNKIEKDGMNRFRKKLMLIFRAVGCIYFWIGYVISLFERTLLILSLLSTIELVVLLIITWRYPYADPDDINTHGYKIENGILVSVVLAGALLIAMSNFTMGLILAIMAVIEIILFIFVPHRFTIRNWIRRKLKKKK